MGKRGAVDAPWRVVVGCVSAASLTQVLLSALLCLVAAVAQGEENAAALPASESGIAAAALQAGDEHLAEYPAGEAVGDADVDDQALDGAQIRAALPADNSDLVMHAMGLIGTPYRRGGNSPETGFDCSGFIRHLFLQARGVVLPRSSRDVYALPSAAAQPVSREALATGDLVFFRIGRLGRRIDHVGLYLGDGRMVHAPASGGEVRIDPLALPYWQRHYAGARRILLPGKPALSETRDDLALAADAAAADTPAADTGNADGDADNDAETTGTTVARDLGDIPTLPYEDADTSGD